MQPDPSMRSRAYGPPTSTLDFGHIIGDPFALATVSIAMARPPLLQAGLQRCVPPLPFLR